MTTTVEELLNCHFSQRSLEEQLKIVAEGPPRPTMQNEKIKECDLVERFTSRERFIYNMEMWLCGCEERNAFYCWTCLLFVKNEKTPFSMPGFLDTKDIRTTINVHKKSSDHFSGMLRYTVFQSNNMSVLPKDVEDDEFSGKNREVLERIIDTVCVMVSQLSPASVGTNYSDLQAQCVRLLHLIKTYDDFDVVNEARDFIQKNPRTVLDIICSLAILIKKEIKKELKLSTFVSIILNGHSEVNNNLILSIVVRYVRNGQVYERLLGFSLINLFKTKITEFVQQLIIDCEIEENFVAISSDGVVLPKDRLYDFLSWLQSRHPKTYFVPCHFHELHLVLQQTLSSVFPECDLFFRTLRSMKNYFERYPQMCRNLYVFSCRSVLDLSNVKMTDSQFLRVLKLNRQDIIKFLAFVTPNSRTVEHFGFIVWLQDCQTVFLLELFFMLFAHTAFINEMLGSNSPDSALEYYVIESTLTNLRLFKEYRFVKVCAKKNPDTQKSLEVKKVKRRLSELFENIVLLVIQTIEARFRKAISLGFLGILDFENRDNFVISYYHLKILSIMEYKFISVEQLITEWKVMGEHGWLTGRKSVYEVLEFLHQNKLHRSFKNLFRLAEFIASLPCKPVHNSSPNSKLDSINAWGSCLQIPESESLLCVENNCLEYLKSLTNFYDQVISELKHLLKKP